MAESVSPGRLVVANTEAPYRPVRLNSFVALRSTESEAVGRNRMTNASPGTATGRPASSVGTKTG